MAEERVLDQPAPEVEYSNDDVAARLLERIGQGRKTEAATPAKEPEAAEEAEEAEVEADDAEVQSDEAEEADEATAEEDTEEEGAEEPEDQTYTVKVAGEEQQVTLQELLNGYSRTADYQRKTQATAEVRKQTESERQALEAERQAVKSEREQYAQVLSKADEMAKAASEVQIDMAKVKAGDKEEYAKYIERNEAREQRQRIAQEQQRVAELSEQENAKMRAQAIEQITASLSEPETGLPGWTDPTKREKDIESMETMLIDMGFQPKALAALSMIEPFVRLAHDALTLKSMKTSKPAAEKKAPPVKPIRAGAAASSKPTRDRDLEKAAKRARETGSAQDVADYLLLKNKRK